jgi:glycosyltransferase involved in cell wall biosynthesis
LVKHNLQPGRYVFAVSSITPHKNFAVIARALPQLKSLGIQVAVAGAVNDGLFQHTDAEALSGLKRLGYVTDAELRALYEQALVFVFPSLYEGFGIPPLEAMALGCPVLASNAAAMPEVCGDGALYFDPQDESALAQLITRVATQPHVRADLVAKGTARLEAYSWRNAAQAYLNMLRSWPL